MLVESPHLANVQIANPCYAKSSRRSYTLIHQYLIAKEALSTSGKNLRYIAINSNGTYKFDNTNASFIFLKKGFLESTYFNEVKIKSEIDKFWSKNCYTVNIIVG